MLVMVPFSISKMNGKYKSKRATEKIERYLELNSKKLSGLMVKIKFISNLHNKYARYSSKITDLINDGFKFKLLNLSNFSLHPFTHTHTRANQSCLKTKQHFESIQATMADVMKARQKTVFIYGYLVIVVSCIVSFIE